MCNHVFYMSMSMSMSMSMCTPMCLPMPIPMPIHMPMPGHVHAMPMPVAMPTSCLCPCPCPVQCSTGTRISSGISCSILYGNPRYSQSSVKFRGVKSNLKKFRLPQNYKIPLPWAPTETGRFCTKFICFIWQVLYRMNNKSSPIS